LDKCKEWWDEIDVGQFLFFGVGWVGIRHVVFAFGTWVKYAIFFLIIFCGFRHVIDMVGLKKKNLLLIAFYHQYHGAS